MEDKKKAVQEARSLAVNEKILWSVQEAASYCGISAPRIRKLAKMPDCPFTLMVGRVIRIKPVAFLDYIDKAKEI